MTINNSMIMRLFGAGVGCLISLSTIFAAPIGETTETTTVESLPEIEIQAEITQLSNDDVDVPPIKVKVEPNGDVVMFNSARVAIDEVRMGDLVIFGGSGEVAGRLTGDLVVFGGSAKVTGHVQGDAVVFGGSVFLGSEAEIDGDLVAIGGSVKRSDGAVIAGESVLFGGEGIGFDHDIVTPSLRLIHTGFRASILLTWLVLSFVTVLLFTRSIGNTTEIAMSRPVQSVLAGFVFHVSSLMICIVLTVIVIGIPLAFLGFFLWLLIGVFGTTVGFVTMGHLVLNKLQKENSSPLFILLIGFVILAAIRFVPFFIGWTLWQMWGMAGIGATILSRFGSNKPWFGSERKLPTQGMPMSDQVTPKSDIAS